MCWKINTLHLCNAIFILWAWDFFFQISDSAVLRMAVPPPFPVVAPKSAATGEVVADAADAADAASRAAEAFLNLCLALLKFLLVPFRVDR
jgi:hypothetical protein